MRIVSGQFKGRRFHPPADKWPTRPTTDFAKEGLFNILANQLDFAGLKVLDLFAGTGNLSYEFISRGCTDLTYVERFRGCVKFAEQTAKTLDIEPLIKIVRSDVFKFIKRTPEQFDFIFADPPYDLPSIDTIPDLVFEHQLLKENGWFVLEHGPKNDYQEHPHFVHKRKYGHTVFSFFE
ncbi:MAG TPA: methyltransferase domain-containing protein [Bacteroidetes bacterium]|nr:methyltransferase domain-containing protein [Bacteroidota bacterium]